MNKAELIIELGNIKSEIMNANLTALPARTAFMESTEEKLDKIVLDLLNEDNCFSCPAMKKVDDLADAINQGYMVSERTKQPFKIDCIERKIEVHPFDAEKMARGGTN